MGNLRIDGWGPTVQPGEVTYITIEDREAAEVAAASASESAEAAKNSLGSSVESANIVEGRLILKQKNGVEFDAGPVSTAEAILSASRAQGSAAAAAASRAAAESASATAQGVANESVTSGAVVGNDLVLKRKSGGEFVAGNVRGPAGPAGPNTVPTRQAVAEALAAPDSAAAAAVVAFGAHGRAFQGAALQPVTDRFPIIVAGLLSDGTKSEVNTQTSYRMARPTQRVALVYGNLADFNGAAAPNNITVRASVKVNGGWVPVFFHGRRDVVIEPDALVTSDPIGAPLDVDQILEVRTRVSVTLGEKWSHNILTDNAKGEGTSAGTAGADLTLTGSIAANRTYGVGPYTVLGDAGGKPTLVGIGDSIMQGQSDSINAADSPTSTLAWGYARRFAWANHIPFMNLGVIGDTAFAWARSSGRKYALRRSLASDGAVAIVNFGVNDLSQGRTVAQIKDDLLVVWQSLSRLGVRVHQTTITPMTAPDGVTPLATEPLRVELNGWIRTAPSPLAGYLDLADAAETSRNSGVWKQGFATDGIHPQLAGHAALAAAIPATLVP